MLDVQRLRVFRQVAREGSFLAAAHELHFSQSAVSQQIAALEREAGTQLVERHARGVDLTPAGRRSCVTPTRSSRGSTTPKLSSVNSPRG